MAHRCVAQHFNHWHCYLQFALVLLNNIYPAIPEETQVIDGSVNMG